MRKILTDLNVLRDIPHRDILPSNPESFIAHCFFTGIITPNNLLCEAYDHANPTILPNWFFSRLNCRRWLTGCAAVDNTSTSRRKKDFTPTSSTTNTTPSWVNKRFLILFQFCFSFLQSKHQRQRVKERLTVFVVFLKATDKTTLPKLSGVCNRHLIKSSLSIVQRLSSKSFPDDTR